MLKYDVVPFYSGCMSGAISEKKLESVLNERGAQGWRFVRSIHETKRVFLAVQRETHFLIFERQE